MGRKQLSGAQKRRLAKARALVGGQLMPRPPTAADLSSLTGVAREKSKNYRDWKAGKMSHDAYLVSVRGLSALAAALTALEAERQRAIDERLARGIEALEAQRSGVPTMEYPALSNGAQAGSGPGGGELMPRETSDSEVSE